MTDSDWLSPDEGACLAQAAQAALAVHDLAGFGVWLRDAAAPLLPHVAARRSLYDADTARLVTNAFASSGGYQAEPSSVDARSPLLAVLAEQWRTLSSAPAVVEPADCVRLWPGIQARAPSARAVAHAVFRPRKRTQIEVLFVFYLRDENLPRAHRMISLLLPYMHRALARACTVVRAPMTARKAEPAPELTARQREILSWVGQGKTNNEIATALSLSPLTVKNHLQASFAKLGARNRAGAVAIVMELQRRRCMAP